MVRIKTRKVTRKELYSVLNRNRKNILKNWLKLQDSHNVNHITHMPTVSKMGLDGLLAIIKDNKWDKFDHYKEEMFNKFIITKKLTLKNAELSLKLLRDSIIDTLRNVYSEDYFSYFSADELLDTLFEDIFMNLVDYYYFRSLEVITKMNDELKVTEKMYRTVVEGSLDGIGIIQNEKIVYCNKRLANMLGYKQVEIIGKKYTKFFHPSEIKRVKKIYENRISGKYAPKEYEAMLKHKNGSNVYAEISGNIVFYDGEIADLVFVENLNKVEISKNDIVSRSRIIEKFLDISPSIIIGIDKDEKIFMVNKAARKIFGYKKDELIGKNWFNKCIPKK